MNNIGVAAHICAAAELGPRFDKRMSKSERISIGNGIWLCQNCAAKIDRDVKKYTTETLKGWRKRAEEQALLEIGKAPCENSNQQQILAQAMTGLPVSYIPSAIKNIHSVTEKSLEMLDDRFSIETSFIAGKPQVLLNPREPVRLDVKLISKAGSKNSLFEHISHGKDAYFEPQNFYISGSRLLDKLLSDESLSLTISQVGINYVQKIWLENDGEIWALDDIHGLLKHGSVSANLSGFCCGGILSILMTCFFKNPDNSKLTVIVDFDKWLGHDIRHLPYFEKVMTFYEKIYKGWSLMTSIEIDGRRVLQSNRIKIEKNVISNILNFLKYTEGARSIAEKFNVILKFNVEIDFSKIEHQKIQDVASLIKNGGEVFDNKKSVYSKIIVSDCGVVKNSLLNCVPTVVRLEKRPRQYLSIFGVEIKLPDMFILLTSVTPFVDTPISEIKDGDELNIEWRPDENTRYQVYFCEPPSEIVR